MGFRTVDSTYSRDREYCDFTVDIYDRCAHGCLYCNRREYNSCILDKPSYVINIPTAVQLEGKKIMLCYNCDPYPNDILDNRTRFTIEYLKTYGANISVLTKGGLAAVRDFDLYDENDSFGITLTARNNTDSRRWEPQAALPNERIQALKLAKRAGIRTWVSLEPILFPEDVVQYVHELHAWVDYWRVGVQGIIGASIVDNAHFGIEIQRVLDSYGCNYFIKNTIA